MAATWLDVGSRLERADGSIEILDREASGTEIST